MPACARPPCPCCPPAADRPPQRGGAAGALRGAHLGERGTYLTLSWSYLLPPTAGLGKGVAPARAAVAAAPLGDAEAEAAATAASIAAYSREHNAAPDLVFTAAPYFEEAPLIARSIFGVIATPNGPNVYQLQRQKQFASIGITEPKQSFNAAPYAVGDRFERSGTQLFMGNPRAVVIVYTVTGGTATLPLCTCRMSQHGGMVACDNAACPQPDEWYHLECVGLTVAPSEGEQWFCSSCG